MNKDKLRKVLWLAFQASSPMGMGFLHAAEANKLTEDNILEAAGERDGQVYTDYLFGRMMKTSFKLQDDGSVKVSPEIPNLAYHSWGRVYKDATELLKAADEAMADSVN